MGTSLGSYQCLQPSYLGQVSLAQPRACGTHSGVESQRSHNMATVDATGPNTLGCLLKTSYGRAWSLSWPKGDSRRHDAPPAGWSHGSRRCGRMNTDAKPKCLHVGRCTRGVRALQLFADTSCYTSNQPLAQRIPARASSPAKKWQAIKEQLAGMETCWHGVTLAVQERLPQAA